MKITSNFGMLLLAIYLILIGVMSLFGLNLAQFSLLIPIVALASGVLILLGR
jgi:hypothetical protein